MILPGLSYGFLQKFPIDFLPEFLISFFFLLEVVRACPEISHFDVFRVFFMSYYYYSIIIIIFTESLLKFCQGQDSYLEGIPSGIPERISTGIPEGIPNSC